MKKYIIFIIFVIQAFIFNFTNVVTPNYLTELGLPHYTFGYFNAIWSFGMLLSSPFWGSLSGQFRKKDLIIVGSILYGGSQLGFYLFDSIIVLAVLRLISGIGVGAIVTLLLAHLILQTDSKDRSKVLGYRMGSLTLGMTLSYTISGYVGLLYTKEMFLYQSFGMIVFLILILVFMKEKRDPVCMYPKQIKITETLTYLKHLDYKFIVLLFSITLTTMSFINLDKFLDLYIIDAGYQVSMVGNVKLVFGIVLIVTNFVLIPHIKTLLGNTHLLQMINVIMAVIIIITFWDSDIIVMLYTVFLIFIMLKAIFIASEQHYISMNIPRKQLPIFMGIRQSFTCLGMILGPIIGGHLYQVSPHYLFQFNILCLLVSSILLSVMKLSRNESKELVYSA